MVGAAVILKSIKRRLGFTAVIAAAVLGAAVISGDSPLVAVLAILVVGVISAFVAGRRSRSSEGGLQRKRQRGEPITVSYIWKCSSRPDLTGLAQVLNREGLTREGEDQSSELVVLHGGSQLWTRLWGGYFVDPRRLPVRAELRAIRVDGSSVLELDIRDRLVIAVRDEELEERYAQAAENIRTAVEAGLEGASVVEAESGTPPKHVKS